MANPQIKQIQVAGTTYDIEALQFNAGTLSLASQWKDYIDATASAGFKFIVCSTAVNTPKGVTFTPRDSSTPITGTLEASSADKGIYLVYHPHQDGKDSYDEYVAAGSGASAFWEKLGNTDIDLSGKADKGTYTSTGPSSDATSSAGAGTATGTATITYKLASTATGSAGAGSSSNTGNAGAATVSVTGAAFSGTAATLTQAAHKHSFSASASYTPAGSVTHAADTTETVLKGVKVTGTTAVVNSVSAGTAATKKGVKVATTAAETGTVSVSYTKQTLGGTTSFNTDAIKSVSLSASTVTTDGPAYIESISGSAPSLGGQKAVPTNAIKNVKLTSGTSTSTGAVQYVESVTHTGANLGAASTTVVSTGVAANGTGVCAGKPTVTNGVLSFASDVTALTGVKTAGTVTVVTGYPNFSGGALTPTTKYLTGSGDAADTSNVTISGGSYSSVTKYMKSAGTAAAKASVTITDGAVSLGGVTTFAKSGLATAALAEDTDTTPAFAFNTDAIKSVSSTTVSVATNVGADGTANAITAIGALGFSGTAATISMSGDTGNGGAVSIAYTPAGSVTGGQVTIAAHSHSYTAPSAHTHSITLTDTTVTGTASVAVSNHTHNLSSHTHNVTI